MKTLIKGVMIFDTPIRGDIYIAGVYKVEKYETSEEASKAGEDYLFNNGDSYLVLEDFKHTKIVWSKGAKKTFNKLNK